MVRFRGSIAGGGVLAWGMLAITALAATSPAPVIVQISGLEEVSGDLYLAVYDSPKEWLGDHAVLRKKVDIDGAREADRVSVQLALTPGDYALSLFYDRNGNGRLDTNFIGIPREPVASSNNARPRFGPPRYEDAVFTVGTEPVVQQIALTDV